MPHHPHLRLAQLPTPITYLTELSQDLGVRLYVKRDDLSGMELSGNKIRKLEYLLEEAKRQACDCILTAGAIQSNHCRATAFAARELGMQAYLFLECPEAFLQQDDQAIQDTLYGNPFLSLMSGGKIFLLKPATDLQAAMDETAEKLRKQGKNPFVIPVGGSNALGSLGYQACLREILEQEQALDEHFDHIALAVGSCGTFAGLYAGNLAEQADRDIFGISVSHPVAEMEEKSRRVLQEMQSRGYLGAEFDLTACAFHFSDDYIGEGYAKFSTEEIAALTAVSRRTGIVFDPCYTGKAFLGLLEEVKKGHIPPQASVLFIHTGGLFGWTQEAIREAVHDLSDQIYRY